MLLPRPAKRKGEYDLDLLTGLAKLQDADSVEEASSMLSNREKLMVLGDDAGVGRLHQLAAMRGLQDERPPE
jgi:hypothetical protein